MQTHLLIALLIFRGVLLWLLAFLFTPLLPVSLISSLLVDDGGLSDWLVDVSEETDVVGWSALITGSNLCCSVSLAITCWLLDAGFSKNLHLRTEHLSNWKNA